MLRGIELVRTVYCVVPIFAVPAGDVRFCALTAFTHVERREPLREQLVGIDVDHDLAVLSAGRCRQGHALDRRELLPDPVDSIVEQLLFVERVGCQAELQHRHARGIELHDDRSLDADRHHRADGVGCRDDLRDRKVEIDVRLEVDLLHRQPVERLRLHVADAVHVGAHRILAVGGDALLHLRRAQAAVLPDDGHPPGCGSRERCRSACCGWQRSRERRSAPPAHRMCRETAAQTGRCP